MAGPTTDVDGFERLNMNMTGEPDRLLTGVVMSLAAIVSRYLPSG
jgi:hypothetical protein